MNKGTHYLSAFISLVLITGCSLNKDINTMDEVMDTKSMNLTLPNTNGGDSLFFDDFIYTSATDFNLKAFGWMPRSGSGGPGPANAIWSTNYITFVSGPVNKVLRLKARVKNGIATQSEMHYNKVNMFTGTYAARVYYTTVPDAGSKKAAVVEAGFWTASDYESTTGTNNYSECDFEYLPTRGWGYSVPAMHNTTWFNDTSNDGDGESLSTVTLKDFSGWHTLRIVVANNHVKYYDGDSLLADHSGIYYPRSKMEIIPVLWFIDAKVESTWHIDIDWFYYAQDKVLSLSQVEEDISNLRLNGIKRQNTVK